LTFRPGSDSMDSIHGTENSVNIVEFPVLVLVSTSQFTREVI